MVAMSDSCWDGAAGAAGDRTVVDVVGLSAARKTCGCSGSCSESGGGGAVVSGGGAGSGFIGGNFRG